jgi:hypothetical protein
MGGTLAGNCVVMGGYRHDEDAIPANTLGDIPTCD